MSDIVRIEKVSKRFGDFTAVNAVSLEIRRGEFFSLLGASGCGKTTLLRMLAGFETPSEGRIIIDGADMSLVPPYERPVNMMFQSYALFPHMSVAANVAFGLKQEGMARPAIRERVRESLALVEMEGFAGRKPAQLSGGQRQRVALARCLAKQPKLLLLDEPMAALDKRLREQTGFELVKLQERVGITFVMVTHDQEEAMTMSGRIGVMKEGRIAQVGTPLEIYEYPASRFCAEFVGTANLFEGAVTGSAGESLILDGSLAVEAPPAPPGTRLAIMVRPEKIAVRTVRPDLPFNVLPGKVTDIAYLGGSSNLHVALEDGKRIQVSTANIHHAQRAGLSRGEAVWLSWHPADAVVLPP